MWVEDLISLLLKNETLWYIHCLACFLMTGIIWFVQVVHYPLFHSVSSPLWPDYAKQHQWRTSLVVAPIMLVEVFSGILIWLFVHPVSDWFFFNMGLLFFIWLSTGWIQMPLHHQLRSEKQGHLIDNLVKSNWIRTFSWTLRCGLLLYYGTF